MYDQWDSAIRRRKAWRKKAEEEARRSGRGILWDPDDVWSRDEETLRTEQGDRKKRREETLTWGRLPLPPPPPKMLEVLQRIHTPGEAERAKKRETLFLPLKEARPAVRQRPVTMQGRSPGPLQQSVSVEVVVPLRSRGGGVDMRSKEPPSPSPLRRSCVPDDGDENDEGGGGNEEGAPSRWSDSESSADREIEERAPSGTALRSQGRKALPNSPPNPLLEPDGSPDASGPREPPVLQ
jgi:hypothetical protein